MPEMTLQQLKDEQNKAIDMARDFKEKLEAAGKTTSDQYEPAEVEKINALCTAAETARTAYQKKNEINVNLDRLSQWTDEQNAPEPEKQRKRILDASGNDANASIIQWQGLGYNRNQASLSRRLSRQWQKDEKASQSTADYHKAWLKYLGGNVSSGVMDKLASTGMSSDNEERGGYFIPSMQFMTDIIKQVDDEVYVQKMSRVIMMPAGRSLGARVRRARLSTFAWAGENTDITPTRDTTLAYGTRSLTPNYLQGSTIISRDLLRNVPSMEGMVLEEVGIDLGYKLEPAFIGGDGNQKPLGLMTPSTNGISTGRDFATRKAINFSFDDFVVQKHNLKLKYRSNAQWMLHRYVLMQTALLKVGNGQYLWQQSRTVGEPDRILGLPAQETEWMPYVESSGQYYSILGDFSWYWIVWEMGMEMQRLIETQAKTNEVEYMFRCKLDAQPMLEEAFVRGVRT